jgi:hypothetical protein
MKNHSNEILNLMYSLANDQPYCPPSYTTIREFTPSFVKLEEIRAKFVAEPPMAKYEWVPEESYPKMYTKGYKKTILPSL